MINLHKLYYKDYFNLAGEEFEYIFNEKAKGDPSLLQKRNNNSVDKPNDKLLKKGLLNAIPKNSLVNKEIKLKIAYPGLVTGIGISHEAKIEGEFKLGVHFDYTYGMPIVYGSSIKGVLRSYFDEFHKSNNIDNYDLIKDIFEGKERDLNAEKNLYNGKTAISSDKRLYKNKSIYNRDIFFDAVLTKADKDDHILASDSITPHDDNPLKNPIPLTFLKIASGCELEFRFRLVESLISIEKKLAIFKNIIQEVGVGAKTNVGYGQFID